MDQMKMTGRSYNGFEYKEVLADSSQASMLLDCYQCFGWYKDDNFQTLENGGKVILKLKRDRKLVNKVELTRLQRNFEDCIEKIHQLEKSKSSKANVVALAVGLIGTAFIAGSVFAITAEQPLTTICIILAIPGFAGWISPYFLHKHIKKRRERIVAPLIEDMKNNIDDICEKGTKLLE